MNLKEAIASADQCCELEDFEIGARLPLSIRRNSPMMGYPRSSYGLDAWNATYKCEGGVLHTIWVVNDILRKREDNE